MELGRGGGHWGGLCTGIFYGSGIVLFANGIADETVLGVDTSTIDFDLENWNKFTMTWDGITMRCYINDILVGSREGLRWKETELFIGGWRRDPWTYGGVAWSNVNGYYRNLVFIE